MIKKTKKLILIVSVLFLAICTSFDPITTKAVYEVENVYESDMDPNENFNLRVQETVFEIIYQTYNDNGILDECIKNKLTGKVYLNGTEVNYSSNMDSGIIHQSPISPLSNIPINSPEAWEEQLYLSGLSINFQAMIQLAGSIASQLYLAHIGFTTSAVLAKLAATSLNQHYVDFVNVMGDVIIDYVAGAVTSALFNVVFSFSQYITKGMVYLNNGTVPVHAFRYKDYKTTVTVLGQSFTASSNKVGTWWSQDKPF